MSLDRSSAMARRTLMPGQRIRVLVVDDSVVIRRLVTHALEQDPLIEVAGVAANGVIALQRIPQLNPDVITLDVEMPEMDGLALLREMRRQHRDIRVIMFSTMTERGAAITLEALTLGADDYVTKASNEGSLDRSMARLRQELLPKIKQFFVTPGQSEGPKKIAPSAPATPATQTGSSLAPLAKAVSSGRNRPRVLAIGVSTGGPAALGRVIPQIPADYPLPILIVQHMPPLFTRFLAEHLQSQTKLRVREAVEGEMVQPGTILIAPGDWHLRVVQTKEGLRTALDQGTPMNSCRPAVDALFSSLAEALHGDVLAAVLTGMGQDGMRGAQLLKAQGATILAQDRETSVVWGMPGAVVEAGVADYVLPLDQVVPQILRCTRGFQFAATGVLTC